MARYFTGELKVAWVRTYALPSELDIIIRVPVLVFNTLRPRQNGRSFPDDIFKSIFLKKMYEIRLEFHWSLFLGCPINNIPALVQIMAWRRLGDKPLSEPMIVTLPTHICVTRPQWVKTEITGNAQGPDSIWIWHLTSIGNHIVEIRRSYDRLISTMGFPILVRWHLYIESGPRFVLTSMATGTLIIVSGSPLCQTCAIWGNIFSPRITSLAMHPYWTFARTCMKLFQTSIYMDLLSYWTWCKLFSIPKLLATVLAKRSTSFKLTGHVSPNPLPEYALKWYKMVWNHFLMKQ